MADAGEDRNNSSLNRRCRPARHKAEGRADGGRGDWPWMGGQAAWTLLRGAGLAGPWGGVVAEASGSLHGQGPGLARHCRHGSPLVTARR